MALGLVGCKSKADKQLVTVKKKKITVNKTDSIISQNEWKTMDFPADTIYPARILTGGGVFHEDEVDPHSSKYKWMGIFKTDTGYYIRPTQIKLTRENDAVLDEAGQKTGWMVSPSVKDTSILLISGLDYLQSRPITAIPFKNEYILPGEHEDFICNGIKYILYATGTNKSTSLKREPYNVSGYKLFIKAVIGGQEYNQVLLSVAMFDDVISTLIFIGDIDGDGRPDLIMDTTNDYNMQRATLYLSKPAETGKLLKVVGWHAISGC
ncbi:hypothetical protein ACFQZI_01035 [Mucilaginibacter lutimaris]|uniref:VCBS repeat-containing protein n=1 Tax=Mucilaginibacter lutimaris TaxID=931629 RepID=A0ABW2ZBN1_9SPHI